MTRPLRILMTVDAVGGVWRYAMDLGGALAANGHDMIFAGLGPLPSDFQRQEATATGALEWGRLPLDWMAARREDLAGVAPWLEDLSRRHRPDLLHLNLPSQAAAPRDGPPRVVVTHSCLATWFRAVDGAHLPEHLAWQADLTAAGLRNADRVVAPSAAHAALTEAIYGAHGIAAVPNSGRSPLGEPSCGNGQVVAAARWWDKAKNGEVLDRAADLTGHPVVMVGSCDGPDGQRFTPAHAQAEGVLPYPDTMDRIAAASLFVSPSLYEPFGLAALEAARAARPLLLADLPVYHELWGRVAQFFDPRDPVGLARRIKALLGSPSERRALGAAAQRRALEYTPARQAGTMTDIYREITAASVVRAAS